MGPLRIRVLQGTVAVCRLDATARVPSWLRQDGPLTAVTRTAHELSIVCDEACVPPEVRAERDFAVLAVEGPLPFDVVGVMAALAAPLAAAGIPILAISTFDTDYVLVRRPALASAVAALRASGHLVDTEPPAAVTPGTGDSWTASE